MLGELGVVGQHLAGLVGRVRKNGHQLVIPESAVQDSPNLHPVQKPA
jgi:hypothetical protein